jgi:hypothetical protein
MIATVEQSDLQGLVPQRARCVQATKSAADSTVLNRNTICTIKLERALEAQQRRSDGVDG